MKKLLTLTILLLTLSTQAQQLRVILFEKTIDLLDPEFTKTNSVSGLEMNIKFINIDDDLDIVRIETTDTGLEVTNDYIVITSKVVDGVNLVTLSDQMHNLIYLTYTKKDFYLFSGININREKKSLDMNNQLKGIIVN